MKITENKVVSLAYTLTVDGDIIETVTIEKPMMFIFGTGYLLPKFEENILNQEVGYNFDFNLSAKEGYGDINEDAIVELPKNLFEVEGKVEENLLVVGNTLPMMDSEGNRLNGTIDEITEEMIIMNFNHPLAGAELHFSGSVVEIREATEEELTNGLFGEKAESSGCSTDDCSSCGGGCS